MLLDGIISKNDLLFTALFAIQYLLLPNTVFCLPHCLLYSTYYYQVQYFVYRTVCYTVLIITKYSIYVYLDWLCVIFYSQVSIKISEWGEGQAANRADSTLRVRSCRTRQSQHAQGIRDREIVRRRLKMKRERERRKESKVKEKEREKETREKIMYTYE